MLTVMLPPFPNLLELVGVCFSTNSAMRWMAPTVGSVTMLMFPVAQSIPPTTNAADITKAMIPVRNFNAASLLFSVLGASRLNHIGYRYDCGMGILMGLVGFVLSLFAGAVALVLSLFEMAFSCLRRLVEWCVVHPKSGLLLLLSVVALGGMVFFLTQRGGDGDGGGESGDNLIVDLPTLVPEDAVSAVVYTTPEAAVSDVPTVQVPFFLQTKVAGGGGGGGAAAEGTGETVVFPNTSGDSEITAVGLSASPELRLLVGDVNRVRRAANAQDLYYLHNQAATDMLREFYRPSMSDGIFAVAHAGWQARYSAGGGYLPSNAYVYVCVIEECDAGAFVDADPVFLSPSTRSYTGAFLENQGRRAYLFAVAPRYASLDRIPPVDQNGMVFLRGSTDGGANVSSMTVTLYYRGLFDDGPDYGLPLARITNPDVPPTGDALELPAGRWETSGQSFDIDVDLSQYFEEDGRYTLALRANTGHEQEYIAAYTVEVGRNRFGILSGGDLGSTVAPPTPTPEPTRAVGPGKLSQPGFDGLRISQLAEQDWGSGAEFFMVACRADESGPPARWVEGVAFSGDGRYLSDGSMVVVLVPGDIYPAVGVCHRLAVRFDGVRSWDFCRRPGTCGSFEGLQLVLPHYVMLGTEYWKQLDLAQRCDSSLPSDEEYDCWRSTP